uniref:endo-polygalacturonase n=1 Tax=Lygus lineolaris TaxID=50650 RepID=A0A126CQW9_LYGLI|nr:polygalacturonase 16 [Lygus lineolaris]
MTTDMLLGILLCISAVAAVDVWNIQQLEAAKKGKDKHIIIKDLNVPAGTTLNLERLKPGTTVVFSGRVTFGYEEWEGNLIKISGKNVRIEGGPGSLIDGEGARWWDGQGRNDGKKKPKLISLQLTDSVVTNLNFKNSPAHGVSINKCKNLHISNINFNNKDGHTLGGHNTDAFDVGNSDVVTIADCYVENQDDCLAINSGTRIVFERNTCIGGHGISIGSVGGRSNNIVEDVTVRDCKVINNDNGVRIKTNKDKTGRVTNVRFINVELQNIRKAGISIQGNYANSGAKGDPTGGVPIQDLVIDNVHGTVNPKGTNIVVWVANASKWTWNSFVTGGGRKANCTGIPAGVEIPCGV